MNFYRDYHFYIAICAFVVLLIGFVTDYFGLFESEEVIITVISYILSFLIAFNVVKISDSKKDVNEIKKDITSTKEELSDAISSAIDLSKCKKSKKEKNKEISKNE